MQVSHCSLNITIWLWRNLLHVNMYFLLLWEGRYCYSICLPKWPVLGYLLLVWSFKFLNDSNKVTKNLRICTSLVIFCLGWTLRISTGENDVPIMFKTSSIIGILTLGTCWINARYDHAYWKCFSRKCVELMI